MDNRYLGIVLLAGLVLLGPLVGIPTSVQGFVGGNCSSRAQAIGSVEDSAFPRNRHVVNTYDPSGLDAMGAPDPTVPGTPFFRSGACPISSGTGLGTVIPGGTLTGDGALFGVPSTARAFGVSKTSMTGANLVKEYTVRTQNAVPGCTKAQGCFAFARFFGDADPAPLQAGAPYNYSISFSGDASAGEPGGILLATKDNGSAYMSLVLTDNATGGVLFQASAQLIGGIFSQSNWPNPSSWKLTTRDGWVSANYPAVDIIVRVLPGHASTLSIDTVTNSTATGVGSSEILVNGAGSDGTVGASVDPTTSPRIVAPYFYAIIGAFITILVVAGAYLKRGLKLNVRPPRNSTGFA